MNKNYVAILTLVLLQFPKFALAEWRPSGQLAQIPVIDNCQATGGDIAVARPGPVIYYCQASVDTTNSRHPDAGHFYYVHEFAHHALSTSNERQADCWAARQLSMVNDGNKYLLAAIAHFQARGNEYHPRYGTMISRAQNIQRCASISANTTREENNDKYGRSCCTRFSKCGPFNNQPALPVGSTCSCQYGNPSASGRVCN